MNSNPTTITTAEDVTPEALSAAEEVFDGWFDNDEPIDWYAFADRLEAYGYSLPTMDCPAIKKIQRYVRRLRNDG